MLQRSITGAIFVIVLISCISFNQYTFFSLFFLITILGIKEFYTIAKIGENKPQPIYGTFLAGLMFFIFFIDAFFIHNSRVILLLIPFVYVLFFTELYLKKNYPFRDIAYTIIGLVYVALPFSLLNYIVHYKMYVTEYNPTILLGMFFMIWANDTGAYLSGRYFGKRKLFERISPKKTWEGAIGGALVALTTAYIVSKFFKELAPEHWYALGIIIVVAGNFGDLIESLYKRSKNIKDSGTILPGHGGILDRFDSLLYSIPFIFTYLAVVDYL
jgi:phosphatidate cytidylyltransferase